MILERVEVPSGVEGIQLSILGRETKQMTGEQHTAIEGRTLLLFDGLCGLCHGTVRFLIRHDLTGKLLYAPLESSLAHELLERAGLVLFLDKKLVQQSFDGIVLIEAALTSTQVVTTRSDAAIRVLSALREPWPLAGQLLALTPRWLRELAYGWIARLRYKVFGTYDKCPLPSAAERSLILGAGD